MLVATFRKSWVVASIIGTVMTGSLLYWVATRSESDAHPDDTICETEGCVNAASRILNGMNTSANPCEDFYQYACGGWIAANPIPADRSIISQFSLIGDSHAKALNELLTMNYSNDRDAIKKAKVYFRSCMDEESINQLGAQPALDFIKSLGGMPLFNEKFNEKGFKLEAFLAKTKSRLPDVYGRVSSPLVALSVKADDKNSSRHVILLDQPSLGMPGRDYYLNVQYNSSLVAYRQYMEDYLGELWKSGRNTANKANYSEASVKTAVDEIIQLETELAKILESKSKRLDKVALYKKFAFRGLARSVTSKFRWYRFVQPLMAKVGINIKPNTKVVSHGTPYFTKFMTILDKYTNRVLKNYIIWINLNQRVYLLPKKFRDTQAGYRQAVYGNSNEQPRWMTCVSKVNTDLPMPVGALFVENMFAEKSKKVVEEMVDNMLKYFKEDVPSVDWMDDVTKKEAIVKVNAVAKLLGYPDYIIDKNNPKLDQEFESLIISEGNYFQSENNIYKYIVREDLSKLGKPVDRKKWHMGPAVVNAYYSRNLNLVAFPAGVLQPPFFDPHQPYSMNYGGIGSAIGHELTHGFDTTGSTYDAQGNLVSWWSEDSRKNFEEKAQCVREQYSGFFEETAQMFVNGNLTIGENIADLAGLRIAYEGYKLWKKENEEKEIKLQGLEKFTPEQLLFIGNAQIWCSSTRPAYAKSLINLDYHSPSVFRVDGPVINFDIFGKTFGCKQGEDRLFPKPEETCRVW